MLSSDTCCKYNRLNSNSGHVQTNDRTQETCEKQRYPTFNCSIFWLSLQTFNHWEQISGQMSKTDTRTTVWACPKTSDASRSRLHLLCKKRRKQNPVHERTSSYRNSGTYWSHARAHLIPYRPWPWHIRLVAKTCASLRLSTAVLNKPKRNAKTSELVQASNRINSTKTRIWWNAINKLSEKRMKGCVQTCTEKRRTLTESIQMTVTECKILVSHKNAWMRATGEFRYRRLFMSRNFGMSWRRHQGVNMIVSSSCYFNLIFFNRKTLQAPIQFWYEIVLGGVASAPASFWIRPSGWISIHLMTTETRKTYECKVFK
jgi:hypothetical protein